MSAKVISFINMKGGVAKTTLTINIAKRLANLNKKVLVIDMDPQFNATQSLLLYKTNFYKLGGDKDEELIKEEIRSTDFYKELSETKKTVLQMFESSNIVEPLDNESLIQEVCQNLYLIPGDLTMAKEITGDTSSKVGAVLKHLTVKKILEEYEYILIDCPPTWSVLTHASLFASDYYVIPSKADLYSAIGIKLLEQQIEEKIKNDTVYQMTGRKLKRLGVIFTLVHRKIRSENDRKEYLKDTFKDIKFFEADLPYIPSAPTRFVMFDESQGDSKYSELINSIEKITNELISEL